VFFFLKKKKNLGEISGILKKVEQETREEATEFTSTMEELMRVTVQVNSALMLDLKWTEFSKLHESLIEYQQLLEKLEESKQLGLLIILISYYCLFLLISI